MFSKRLQAGALVLASGLASCGLGGVQSADADSKVAPTEVTAVGEGVFLFPAAGWPKSLSEFMKERSQELRFVDSGIYSQCVRGGVTGYYVVMAPK